MKFHKGAFKIQMNERLDYEIRDVSGWIDETGAYGFHKNGNHWVATDIASGTLIVSAPTRKACVEWIDENQERIIKDKEMWKYKINRGRFIQKLEKEKENEEEKESK